MASLTIRQLDDAVKRRLRLRAARNGRSMEEEARHLLARHLDAGARAERPREIASATSEHSGAESSASARSSAPAATLNGIRILLVIGGGIAAYKALDLIRRLKERGAAVRVVMTRAA